MLTHATCPQSMAKVEEMAVFDHVLPSRSTSAQGHAMALKAGTDMACTEYSGHLNESLAQARTCLAACLDQDAPTYPS